MPTTATAWGSPLDSRFASTRMPPVLRGPISRSLGQRRSAASAADGANGIGGGQAGGQRQKRQARGGNLRAEQNADVESFAGGGDPAVIAASAAGQSARRRSRLSRAARHRAQQPGHRSWWTRWWARSAACRRRWCRRAKSRGRLDRTWYRESTLELRCATGDPSGAEAPAHFAAVLAPFGRGPSTAARPDSPIGWGCGGDASRGRGRPGGTGPPRRRHWRSPGSRTPSSGL